MQIRHLGRAGLALLSLAALGCDKGKSAVGDASAKPSAAAAKPSATASATATASAKSSATPSATASSSAKPKSSADGDDMDKD